MKPVTNKGDFIKRWEAGEFGNRLGVWQDLEEWFRDLQGEARANKMYGLRGREASASFIQDLNHLQVIKHWNPDTHYLCEAAPDSDLLLQGYLMDRIGEPGYELHYSDVPGYRMREGLTKHGKWAKGLAVLHLGVPHWAYELLELYPHHVVEFSTYKQRLGTLNQRHLIWEVRQY